MKEPSIFSRKHGMIRPLPNFLMERSLILWNHQFTEILLAGERKCSYKQIGRGPWSPKLQLAGRTVTYLLLETKTFHGKDKTLLLASS